MMNRITEADVLWALECLNGATWSSYSVRYFNGACHLIGKDGRVVAHGTKRHIYDIALAMHRGIVDNEEAKA